VTPERWQEVKKVLAAVLERPPAERSGYLDQACTDPDLRREVDSLIASHEQGDTSFMEQPAAERGVLKNGAKLGPYEILAGIGAGGMGEVYRAHDPKLKRDVAIKVLPAAFVNDPERLVRFQREARMLASLNHPNIASIYGLEDSNNIHALVMQLAEGPTLAERIAQGPIPIEDVLRIAKQIADALEYAHEKGIIHRDLKPANVKVAADDTVKILDFGLAKALETEPSSAELANSPTLSHLATQAGVLLGTAAYMSPEQAKGKPVDRRADIWAFGCVLYEMLTGKQAFGGDAVTETLAAVLKNEPDWSLLPTSTPMRVRVLLQRCLQKDPKQRLRDIGDARISLDEVLSGAPEGTAALAAAVPVWRRAFPWAAGILAVIITAVAVWNLKPFRAPPPKPVTRFTITLPPGQHLAGLPRLALALSPDGNLLAYVATAQQGGAQQIYVRAMDTGETRGIPGTEGAVNPFFSPDGQWLGFFAGGKLKKISVNGTAAQGVADAAIPIGASWGRQGTIVFGELGSGLQQVSDAGGSPHPLTPSETGDVSPRWPEFLPGSKVVVFSTVLSQGIVAQPIGKGKRRNLVQGQEGTMPHYASSGHLIYVESGNLMAVPFDLERLEVIGEAVPVVQGVSQINDSAQYSISGTGSLVYVPGTRQGGTQRKLVWVSRNGAEQTLAAPVRDYLLPRLSPDGRRLAVGIEGPEETQVWVYDLARDTLARLTFGGAINIAPVWTPDGKRIAFESNKEGPLHVFWQLADGSGGPESLSSGTREVPASWSPDGQQLAFVTTGGTPHIGVLRLSDRKAQTFLQAQSLAGGPQFSPDGHWLAYVSDESGRREVYVQPYPGPGGKWLISNEGGAEPIWNRNGRELYYRSGDKMMAVDITTQPAFAAGKPRQLFEGRYLRSPYSVPFYDVSPDGQRFLMLKPVEQEQAAPTQINVVLNWTEELKRLVPTGK
jgi:Tol biopolymer transport system component